MMFDNTHAHRPTPDRHMLSGNPTQACRIYCLFDGGTFLHVLWQRKKYKSQQIVKMRAMHRPPRTRFVISDPVSMSSYFPLSSSNYCRPTDARASLAISGCIQIDGNRDGCSGHAPDGRLPVTTSIMLIKP